VGRLLIVAGVVLVLAGLLVQMGLPLGRLPGDIRIERETVRVYVPFGSHWYPYSVRRLRENPTIARAGLEAFFRGRMDT